MKKDIYAKRSGELDNLITKLEEEIKGEQDVDKRQKLIEQLQELCCIEARNADILIESEKIDVEKETTSFKEELETKRSKREIIATAVSGGLMVVTVLGLALFEKADGGGIVPSKLLSPALNIFKK